VSEKKSSLFAKPHLDEMGTSGDHAVPAGAVPRSLFKKQTAAEAHESDYGIRDDGARPSLFRKNSLDEMTVRRTEKPVEGKAPPRPPTSPLAGEDSSPREAKASGSANLVRGDDGTKPPHGEPPEHLSKGEPRRARPGAGSYEDPADARRYQEARSAGGATGKQKSRRPGKTGRPGN
jgi:excinuclease ABC subunit B